MLAGRHARLGWHSGAIALVSLLHVALVGECLLGIHGHAGHVACGHVRVLAHAWPASLGWDVLAGRLLGRFDLVAAVAILTTRRRLGRIQACLNEKRVSIGKQVMAALRTRTRVTQARGGMG